MVKNMKCFLECLNITYNVVIVIISRLDSDPQSKDYESSVLSLCYRAQPGMAIPGNTKRGSVTVPLTSYLTGLDLSVLKIKTKIVSCHTADSKPVKQEVNGTVILPPLVFPGNAVDQIVW